MNVTTEQLFTEARTHNGFRAEPIAEATLRQLYDLMKWGPTSANCSPARIVFVRTPEAKRGFVLLPRRWVVERSFAWATRFRRLVRDYERLPQTLAGLHVVAFACLMLKHAALEQVHNSL